MFQDQLKYLFLPADKHGCGYYRMILPATYAKTKGMDITVSFHVSIPIIRQFDVIVMQRIANQKISEIAETARLYDKTIILETDDIIENLHPSNPAFRDYNKGTSALTAYMESIKHVDHVTTTTEELKSNYLNITPNITVIPNSIDFGLRKWPKPTFEKRNDGVVRLGWAGSTSHTVDLLMIGKTIKKLLEKYPHVKYVHYGNDKQFVQFATETNLPQDQIELIPPTDFLTYPERLNYFDIGIAPLQSIGFNRYKSDLKLIEYSACGVPYVCSKSTAYAKYCKHGEDGYMADSESEWLERLSELVEDEDKRLAMGSNAYIRTVNERNMENITDRWMDAWNNARLDKVLGSEKETVATVTRIPGRNDPCPCGSGKKYKKCLCYPAYG